jgi:hypothetical protein
MVKITDPKHFREVMGVARGFGEDSLKSFLKCLKTLNAIRKNDGYSFIMWPDWAPHSFNFMFKKADGEFMFNGGLVLHGCGQNYTVSLSSPGNFPYWSIHT